MRTGRRQGGVREQTRREVQVLRKQRDDIIKMIRSNDRPAAQVVQGILFELLGARTTAIARAATRRRRRHPKNSIKPRHHGVGKLLEYVQDANCVNLYAK